MEEIEILRRRLERERQARKEAERIAETKTRELYEANEELLRLTDDLQELVDQRTIELVRARDEAVAASQAKSAFLANMSHELRTPLNAVIGYSEMLLEEHQAGPDQLLADLRKILGAGRHLLSLINDVLDLSKIEAGKMTTFIEEIAVEELVLGVAETVHPLKAQNQNQLEVRVSEDAGVVRTDVVKLRQILLNLLSNALKFTHGGRVSLRVSRETENRLRFEVKDSGIGMAPEQLARLFQPFAQGDASTTRRYGGTGLGLALSQRFCAALGGEISAESAPGVGSTFSFWIPTELSGTASKPGVARKTEEAWRGTLLVVDDDPAVHDLLRRQLGQCGFDLVFTDRADAVLPLARERRPLAITLDVLMPGRDGWSVLHELKQDPEVSDIPVILLSILDERGLGFALGAADYLVKPVPRGRLLRTLRRQTGGAESQRVLVVEDEVVLRNLLVRMLRSDGWDVVEAENGRVALDRLESSPPAVILLDLMMPEMDGFEFVRELHRRPGGSEIPVVVVTAKDLSPEEVEFFASKAGSVLQKCAYERGELLQIVQALVEKAAAVGPGPEAPGTH